MATWFVREGVANGPQVRYSPDGGINAIGVLRDGAEQWLWTFFDESGSRIEWQCEFRDGERNGIHILYHPNGVPASMAHYVDGVRRGGRLRWSPSGEPLVERSVDSTQDSPLGN